MKAYHKSVTETMTFNNVTLALSSKNVVNKNNISIQEKSILSRYIADNDSLYKKMEISQFWGIMHNGISIFSKEINFHIFLNFFLCNCIYVSGVDSKYLAFVVPSSLINWTGGVNRFVNGPFTEVGISLNIKQNTYTKMNQFI